MGREGSSSPGVAGREGTCGKEGSNGKGGQSLSQEGEENFRGESGKGG